MSYSQTVDVTPEFMKPFIGSKHKNREHFQQKFGVIVRTTPRYSPRCQIKVEGDQDAVQIAVSEIHEHCLDDPEKYLLKMQAERWGMRNVYLDWNNIRLGAARYQKRLNIYAFCLRVFGMREVQKLFIAGTVPNSNTGRVISDQWLNSTARMPNFKDCTPDIKLQESSRGSREKGVDDMLIAAAYEQLQASSEPHTLILVTGDGNLNGGGHWVSVYTSTINGHTASAFSAELTFLRCLHHHSLTSSSW
jgi:hypothetical protein